SLLGYSTLLQLEQLLAELHAGPVLDQDFEDRSAVLGLDLVHELHRLDDAQRLAGFHDRSDFHEGTAVGRRRAVERSHERRGHEYDAWLVSFRGRRLGR